jgi:hypothetical protein
MIRPHNLQKSLNKLPSCTCKQNYYMLLPNKEAYLYLDRPPPGPLITGCGFLRMTRAQYRGQESECKHHGGVKVHTNI